MTDRIPEECPKCDGTVDTGGECNSCDYDARDGKRRFVEGWLALRGATKEEKAEFLRSHTYGRA